MDPNEIERFLADVGEAHLRGQLDALLGPAEPRRAAGWWDRWPAIPTEPRR
ncbi:MAG: hypothetical protein H6700_08950 [Myxococcales bacterium]|nr:hypothetical protein [Myxococcales bacterium]MCB9531879.1 hypothetical protein [Myxococcales bacterium]